ncbi:hypothetical protein AWB99_16235 [Mycolicibacterium confluentis]|nr:hypothetical protein [Mycolicibacterium confluentis]ORV29728.1 hypothetical protein AWB99_16235 [Mycolicibacterium confluentis]
MLVGHFEHHPKVTLAMAVVAALCVPCVGKLWRAPCRQDVLVAGCLATVMLGIHLCLMLAMAGSSAPAGGGGEHHHGSSAMELAEMSHAPAHGVQFDGFFYVPTALAAAQILLCIGIALRARRC